MTVPPNANGFTSRRPWWNFSLRELLLLMVAIGACIALFRKEYYSRQLSPIIREKKLYELIKKVIHDNSGDIRHPISTGGCNGDTGNASDGIGKNIGYYHLDSEVTLPTAFIRILRDAVRDELVENDCHIHSDRSGSNFFHIEYRYLNNVGLATVIFVPAKEGTTSSKVHFTCFEVSRSAN